MSHNSAMEIVIHGHNLPGRSFRSAGVPLHNVHVAVQVRDAPVDLVPADADEATWTLDVNVVDVDGGIDFRGPAVHGKRGDRFLYLTWGEVTVDHPFAMFRRAKLMLDRIDPALVATSRADGRALRAEIDLTDGYGGPRCARVDPPALQWSVS